MNAIKVDEAHRIQLAVLAPGDLYEPEIISPDEISLRRISQAPDTASRPALVKVEKGAGYSVGVSDQPISSESIKEILSDLPALDSRPDRSEQVTDHYLADLAAKHGLKFATLDAGIKHAAVDLVS